MNKFNPCGHNDYNVTMNNRFLNSWKYQAFLFGANLSDN